MAYLFFSNKHLVLNQIVCKYVLALKYCVWLYNYGPRVLQPCDLFWRGCLSRSHAIHSVFFIYGMYKISIWYDYQLLANTISEEREFKGIMSVNSSTGHIITMAIVLDVLLGFLES